MDKLLNKKKTLKIYIHKSSSKMTTNQLSYESLRRNAHFSVFECNVYGGWKKKQIRILFYTFPLLWKGVFDVYNHSFEYDSAKLLLIFIIILLT